jgi:hypothetical protein
MVKNPKDKVNCCQVKDAIPQKRALHDWERFYEADASRYDSCTKDACSKKFSKCKLRSSLPNASQR